MKKLILLTIAGILLGIFCSAAPVITPKFSSIAWELTMSWNLLRVPQAGDTIVIPAGTTVIVTNHENLGSGSLYIKIYGTLKFIGGKITMGSGSTIIVYSGGTITGTSSSSEQIRLGATKIFQGDAAIAGPQFANVTTGAGFSPYTNPLPVQYLGFTLSHQNTSVLVQWSTTAEVNAAGYEVERSYNGSAWTTIGSVASKSTSTSSVNQYSFSDRSGSASILYYRIRQIDLDGRYSYTPVKSITTDLKKNDVKIYATSGKVMLQFPQQVKGSVSVRIISMAGQIMGQQMVSNALGQIIINTNLKGAYIVSVTNNQDLQTTNQIIL